jgi:hypothetical protein
MRGRGLGGETEGEGCKYGGGMGMYICGWGMYIRGMG